MAPPGAELLGHRKVESETIHKSSNKDLTVRTNYGNVEGVRQVAANGKPVDVWWGIPYATPPIGDLRFKRPVPKSG